MQQKEIILVNKGMNRDLSVSKVDGSAAYDNRNIRLIATDKDTLLSVTNERGNKKVDNISFAGTLVGYGVLNDYILLFTVENTKDEEGQAKSVSYIYRVKYENDSFSSIVIFAGSLGFSTSNPIETIVDYETEDIQKIYWIDGLHVLRFLNFSDAYLTKHLVQGYTLEDPKFDFADNTTWFDSTRTSTVIPTVKITKDNAGNTRANGVAQYFITYYNKNGQQTGIVYSSPLVYLAPEGRGGAADQTNTNSVTVSVSDLDETFENVRLYNIIRTSLDGQVTGNIVGESSIVNGTATFVDDGAHYTSVDPTSFLFLGSSEARFGTMTQKDGTLFLGNIQSAGNEGVDNIEEAIKATAFILSGKDFTPGTDWESNIVEFVYSDTKSTSSETCHIPYVKAEGYYPYESQLNYTSKQITTFKGGEKYRFALRFVRSNGVQSKAFWIGDKVNPYYPKMLSDGYVKRAIAKCYVPELVIEAAQKAGYSSVKLMIAQATYADRSVKAQGIVCPTVFNLYDRTTGKVYARSSWFYRMRNGRLSSTHFSVLGNSNSEKGEVQCNWWNPETTATPFPLYYLDSTGDVVRKPAAFSSYTYISILIQIAHTTPAVGMRILWFTCRYYYNETDTQAAQTFYHYTADWKSNIPTVIEKYEDEANVPTSYRISDEKIKELIDLDDETKSRWVTSGSLTSSQDINYRFAQSQRQYHFVDEHIVTLNSPELSHEAVELDNSSLSFRIVGLSEVTSGAADYDITTEGAEYTGDNVDAYEFVRENISTTDSTLAAWPLYSEFGYAKNTSGEYVTNSKIYHYMVYPWQKTGSLPAFGETGEGKNSSWSVLTKKMMANEHFSFYTFYNNYGENAWSVLPDGIRQTTKGSTSLYSIESDSNTVLVAPSADDVIMTPLSFEYPIYYSNVFADSFPSLPDVKEARADASDAVRLTYATDAQAIIALPDRNSYHILLPRLLSEPDLSCAAGSGETGPYIPWQDLVASNKRYLFRRLSSTDWNTLTDGSYGDTATVNILEKSDSTLYARVSVDDAVADALAVLKDKFVNAYSSVSGYVHLTGSFEDNEVTYLVDLKNYNYNKVSYELYYLQSSSCYCLKLTTVAPMSYVSIELTALSYTHEQEVENATSAKIRIYKQFKETDVKFTIWFSPTYYNSEASDKMNLLKSFTWSARHLTTVNTYDKKTDIQHCGYFDRATYIDPVTNTLGYSFVNIAYTPTITLQLGTDHQFTEAGFVSNDYNVKQDVFSLADPSLFSESLPYMFVGELYKDFDILAKQDPALDTRYGGITETAVESNTFVDAGTTVSLDERSAVETYKTTEISGELIRQAIINRQQGLMFVFKLLGKADAATGSASTIASLTCESLSSISIEQLLPTPSSPVSGLTVSNESGVWVSKIDGLDAVETEAIISSTDYKILILRYGYARPGKKRYYTAKNTGVEQWSHTSRKAEYKTQRGGKCYRIIGHDLLYSGKTQAQQIYSQTWKEDNSAKYSTSTLVSSLGDELVLPAVRSSKTLKGRWSQNNRTGLVDLYIGLYHREGYQWELASNIVQVRGRSGDFTKIWEFAESNVVKE